MLHTQADKIVAFLCNERRLNLHVTLFYEIESNRLSNSIMPKLTTRRSVQTQVNREGNRRNLELPSWLRTQTRRNKSSNRF